jgi:hypothetical protein
MFCTVLRPNSGYSPTQLHVTAHTTERKCVYCAVRNKSLNVVQVNLSLKKVISMSSVFTWKLTSLRKLPLTTSSICSTISLLSPFNFRTGPISAAVPYTYIYIYPEGGNSTLLWNLEAHQADYTASHTGWQQK